MENLLLRLTAAITPMVVSLTVCDAQVWTDPRCAPLPTDQRGQFVPLSDGSWLTVSNNVTLISRDGGRTWTPQGPIVTPDTGPGRPASAGSGVGVAIRTASGAIVLVYMDVHDSVFKWDFATDALEADLDVWAIRSLDEGKTWVDRQKILDGYCGSLQNIIQTRDGHLVVPVQDVMRGPLRHVQYVFVSADDGATWQRSNLIDLGGRGDHDGGYEGTVVELDSGRLWMLLRTNLDRFWSAYSDDHGYRWRVLQPSDIDASSSPGFFLRLASGRIALAWCRLYPEGLDPAERATYPRQPPGPVAETAASWQRDEMSIALCDGNGENWTKPVVLMRCKGGNLAYPYVFEATPGELWVIATQANVRAGVRVMERDLLGQ